MSKATQEVGILFWIRSAVWCAASGALMLSLGGCTGNSVRDALGMGKRAPDEFAVVKREPLIIPPGYDLRPPRPGAPSVTAANADARARAAMTGSAPAAVGAPVVIGSADGSPTTFGSVGPADGPSTTTASARASSPGQQALLAQAGSVPESAIRDQVTVETEGRTRVEPALFDQIVAQPATSGPSTPDVVSHEQTPIDFQE